MPKSATDMAIEDEIQNLSKDENIQILQYSRLLKQKRKLDVEKDIQTAPLWTQLIIISTFPFAFTLMFMRTPAMISEIINMVPVFGLFGVVGLWLARRRWIQLENRFLLLVLVSIGVAIAFITPLIISISTTNYLSPVIAAAFLYGITSIVYLTLCIGLYGLVVNLKKSQSYLAGV